MKQKLVDFYLQSGYIGAVDCPPMPSASHPKAIVEGLLPEFRGKLPKAAGRVEGEAEAGKAEA